MFPVSTSAGSRPNELGLSRIRSHQVHCRVCHFPLNVSVACLFFGILHAVTSFVCQHACCCLFLCLLLMEPMALWRLDVRQVLCFKLHLFPFPYLFIVYSTCVCMCVFCVLCMLRWRLGFGFESPTVIHLSLIFKLPLLVLPVCAIIPCFLCGCGIFQLRSSCWHSKRLTHWDISSAPRLSFNSNFVISLPGDLAEVVYV